MPLASAALQTSLQNLMTSPAATAAAAAALWATAFADYAASVVPVATPAAVTAAQAALQDALTTAFGSPSATAAMDAAFSAAAVTLAGGMAPLFTGVPPPGDIGWETLMAAPYPATAALAATKISSAIHAWMIGGTATLVAPPNTPVPAWS